MTAALTDRALLEAWAVNGKEPAARVDRLLSGALPAAEREQLREWPLARRNAALAELRRGRWGSVLEAVVACPACGEELELSFDLDAVAADGGDPAAASGAGVTVATEAGEWELRLPTAADLAAVAATDVAAARRELVGRCLIEAPVPVAELDSAQVEELGEALGAADPFGSLVLALECPECERRWREPLDLGDFLAREAALEARELVAEVHLLAGAYGWTEAEVLELPRERRQVYLELVG